MTVLVGRRLVERVRPTSQRTFSDNNLEKLKSDFSLIDWDVNVSM